MNAKTRELEALYAQLAQLSRTRIDTSPGSAARVRAAQRWLSDQCALWTFCDNAACLRACRCRGRGLGRYRCHRLGVPRVPDGAIAGMRICLDAHFAREDPLSVRGERRRAIDALIAWRRRLGLTPLPLGSSHSARRMS